MVASTQTKAQCTANFVAVQDSVNPSLMYFFGSMNMPSGTTYSWTFGDNTTSTLPDPQHQYNAYGYYLVCLTINVNGCTASYCDSVAVLAVQPCTAYFTWQANTMFNPYQILFYNQSPAGNTSQWYFGDGSTSSVLNPNHIYASAGTYVVCLTSTGQGCTATYCDTITVGANSGCNAGFYVYPDSTVAHMYYAVNQCSGVQPMVYTWSWGDGSTSTGANPSHTYAASGYYTICVSITDATGCTSTYCDSSNYLMRTDAMVTVNVVGGMNGIQNVSELSDVNLYPNPANESVTVSFNSNGNSTVSLLDYTGRTIMSKNITGGSKNFSESFSVSSVADGLYFIKVEFGNTSKLLKLQVNH